MDPVDYGLIAASLVPATRGTIEVNLPTEEIYTAAHEPEPEEPVEEDDPLYSWTTHSCGLPLG